MDSVGPLRATCGPQPGDGRDCGKTLSLVSRGRATGEQPILTVALSLPSGIDPSANSPYSQISREAQKRPGGFSL
jgi:hypothetical protein